MFHFAFIVRADPGPGSSASGWMNIRFCPAMLYAGLPSEPMGSRIEDRTHSASGGAKNGESPRVNLDMFSNSIWICLGICSWDIISWNVDVEY